MSSVVLALTVRLIAKTSIMSENEKNSLNLNIVE